MAPNAIYRRENELRVNFSEEAMFRILGGAIYL